MLVSSHLAVLFLKSLIKSRKGEKLLGQDPKVGFPLLGLDSGLFRWISRKLNLFPKEERKHVDLYTALSEVLQCRTCNKKLQVPVSTCVNGHGICFECVSGGVSACSCSGKISENKHVLLGYLTDLIQERREGILFHETLECPVCYIVLKKPISVCQNGHGICASCLTLLKVCPICRGPFTMGANETLNHVAVVLEKMSRCSFWVFGCTFKGDSTSTLEHEKKCVRRQYFCPVNDCNWAGASRQMTQHVKIQHDSHILSEELHTKNQTWATIHLNDLIPSPQLIILGGRSFWVSLSYTIDRDLSICVQAAQWENHENFRILVVLNDPQYTVSYKSSVNPPDDVLDTARGFTIPSLILRGHSELHMKIIAKDMRSINFEIVAISSIFFLNSVFIVTVLNYI